MQPEQVDVDVDPEGIYAAYAEYNRILRTWFVALGIGGPALFMVNDNVAAALKQAGQLRVVVLLFLAGATAQVLGAFLNKVANWYQYQYRIRDKQAGLRRRISRWYVNQFWPDVLLDIGTIGTFGWAAWLLLTVFARI